MRGASWTVGQLDINEQTCTHSFFGKTRWQSSPRRRDNVTGKGSTYQLIKSAWIVFSLYSRFGDLPCWPPPPHPAYFAEDQFEYLDCDSCSPLCGFSQRTLIFYQKMISHTMDISFQKWTLLTATLSPLYLCAFVCAPFHWLNFLLRVFWNWSTDFDILKSPSVTSYNSVCSPGLRRLEIES